MGFRMKTVVALLKDKAGASSTQLAFMIGLSSSAVLVLVRVGVAFAALFATSDVVSVQDLVDAVLAPYGGRLREGFVQSAPAEWRD